MSPSASSTPTTTTVPAHFAPPATSSPPPTMPATTPWWATASKTPSPTVSRGVCGVDENGMLTSIDERTRISPSDGGAAFTEDGENFSFIPAGTLVSMNLWAFHHGILDEMRQRFCHFLRTRAVENPLKAEFYLPSVPDALIREGKARVRVLETGERWYGVTYREDLPKVQAAMAEMRQKNLYPEKLW